MFYYDVIRVQENCHFFSDWWNILKKEFVYSAVRTALGAGANVRACELETPCLNPVEVALADLFHFEA